MGRELKGTKGSETQLRGTSEVKKLSCQRERIVKKVISVRERMK